MGLLTFKRIQHLERVLESADLEINSILQEYYADPEGQNVGGNIVQISRLHAELVEKLADHKRELLEKAREPKK